MNLHWRPPSNNLMKLDCQNSEWEACSKLWKYPDIYSYEYNDNNNNKKKIPGFKGIISHKVNSAAGVVTAQISDNNGLIFAENFRACPENCKITMTCVGVWKFCTVMMSTIVLGCNFHFSVLPSYSTNLLLSSF